MEYNLLENGWIPVIDGAGKRREVSLTDALLHAHEFRELRDESPLVTAALHRLLLAVIHRAYDGPETLEAWVVMWESGRFDAERVQRYLHEWQDRFDLFDEEYPFYQVGGFDMAKRVPAAKLAQELAAKNNETLFDHSTDDRPTAFTPAEAARLTIANQAFALGGGKGGKSNLFGTHPYLEHAPLIGGVIALLLGDNFFETLMVNLLVRSADYDPPLKVSSDDEPAWEKDGITQPGTRVPEGWLDLLTWQSRCLRLIPSDGRVSEVAYAQGAGIPKDEARPREPLWFYRLSPDDPATTYPVGFSRSRALWRSADSLFAIGGAEGTTMERRPLTFGQAVELRDRGVLSDNAVLRCSLLGLDNDQAKALAWAHQELPVPLALLDDERLVAVLQKGLSDAEAAGDALGFSLTVLSRSLLEYSAGGDSERSADRDAVRALRDSLQGETRYWARLEKPFKEFLRELPEDDLSAIAKWQRIVTREVWRAFEAASQQCNGGSPREMKARVDASGTLAAGLAKAGLTGRKEEG